jgi:hypothetical protein
LSAQGGEDLYIEALRDVLGDTEGKIAAESLWTILDVKAGAHVQDRVERMSRNDETMEGRK